MRTVDEAKGGSDPADDVDAHTIFVRNLPFSLTDSQLENLFSEVGPVRHCFTVKQKGSDQHRGFGYVQFAVTEDAHRAVQEKNGTLLESRKIKVEVAKRRAPLDVRRPKSASLKAEPTSLVQEAASTSEDPKLKSVKNQITPSVGKASEEVIKIKNNLNQAGKLKAGVKVNKDKEQDGPQAQGSSMQRPARTVVVGGLESTEMLDAVLDEGLKCGPIEAIQRNFTELELSSRGLAKDGCKPKAAAIVFLSVKAACKAVTTLHQRQISGSVVWARQLGGEGSKLKQLRLIVRNLPFQVTEATLRDLFSPAGFLWEVTIPRKTDGLSKGFAFVGFTSKVDAQNAIRLVNGKSIGNRPIAVDWAVAKKQYEAAVAPEAPKRPTDVDLDEGESTASESEYDAKDSDDKFGSHQDTDNESEQPVSSIDKQVKPERKKKTHKKVDPDLRAETDRSQSGCLSIESDDDVQAQKHAHNPKMNLADEVDMVKKVLNRVVTSTHNELPSDDERLETLGSEHHKQPMSPVPKAQMPHRVISNGKKAAVVTDVAIAEVAEHENGEENKLSRTVFVRNLPTEAKVPELRKLFADFGEIKSFRLVLHPVTKKSKGNAFLEYVMEDSARAAVAAAGKGGADELGIVLKGRPVSVTMAVDKDSARKIAKETFHKQIEEDKRNLVLAKEGQILVGTLAAEGVSKGDISKRQQLEQEKATKLRSPNFKVSRTRLSVHNFPKTMSEKELKQLCIEAVRSRASKQNPVIKQVKILRDEVSQKSRASAFVEFTEHQHALVALRVLNNNPATFGSERRPIVEFAIENSLVLRKRAANAELAKKWQTREGKRKDRVEDSSEEAKGGKMKKQKTRERNGKFPVSDDSIEGKKEHLTADHKRKREVHPKISKVAKGVQRSFQEESSGSGRESQAEEWVHKIKRGKVSGADRKAAQARRAASEIQNEVGVNVADDLQTTTNFKKQVQKKSVKPKDQVSETKQLKSSQRPVVAKLPEDSRIKKFGLQSRGSNRETQNANKKRKKGKSSDSQDKLDTLVAEYRTKYFSSGSKPTTARGVGVASGDLRRWFE